MKKTFEQDYIKAIKRYARNEYGFVVPKMTKNLKKYSRKRLKKIVVDDEL